MQLDVLTAGDRLRARGLREELARDAGVRRGDVRLVRSPYRVCPLGAHVDHQLGAVTGLALDRCLLLAFSRREDRRVVARSRQFEGAVTVDLDQPPRRPVGDWADLLRGAVVALGAWRPLERGVTMLVDGHEDAGGLSSSAAAGVAYLLALEAANGLALPAGENVELDRRVENDFIGLRNGILDQSSILLGCRGHLMHLDCATGEAEFVPFGGRDEPAFVVLFSGLRSPLADSGYNRRVEECRRAAAELLRAAGLTVTDAPVLHDVPADVFARHQERLDERLRRRARHYFGEQERVRRGVEHWRRGEPEGLGRLMTESGRSSIENYECGNDYLRAANEALCRAPGVWGARFSGAGFRGCCVGLAQAARAEEAAEHALAQYLRACPDVEGKATAYVCRSADGAALLE